MHEYYAQPLFQPAANLGANLVADLNEHVASWSQAGRKHVESQLRTCLKQVFF